MDNIANNNRDSQSVENSVETQYGDQNEDGIDLSLIRENLMLTPTERIQRHQRALEIMKEVRRAGAAAGLHNPDKRS